MYIHLNNVILCIAKHLNMNKIAKLSLLFWVVSSFAAVAQVNKNEFHPSQWVDPQIGSVHSRWFFYTPAAVPFGMAKLSPSTNGSYGNPSGWEAVGYEDGHRSIEGFPCFHEFQVGGVMLMPVTGMPKRVPGKLDQPGSGYRSAFDKTTEKATPGYYSVTLKDYGIKAELTATERVGFQRYTFPDTDSAFILFDIGSQLGESGKVKDAYVRQLNSQTIEGSVTTLPEYIRKYQQSASMTMYFYAELSKPAAQSFVFYRGQPISDGNNISGIGSVMAVRLIAKRDEPVTVKIGLSYTSVENAKKNLEAEATNLDFDQALAQAHQQWNEKLGRIKAEGKNEEDKVKFYTGLFHALLGRGLASDVNGAYPKNDGTAGQIPLDPNGKPIHQHYNTDAIWGAFWNLTQLWALAYPEYYADWVSSQLLVYKDAGWLGDGIAGSKFVSGVGTNFTSLAIAAAYNCGIRNFDVPLAYEACLKNEIEDKNRPYGAGKVDIGFFVKNGYAPYSPEKQKEIVPEGWMFGASHTLEYSFSSYAVAQFAKQLGKTADYRVLDRLSHGWEKLFDTATRLIRPRMTDGSFLKKFDPYAPWVGFQEGNAIQYTFYVPHEPGKLVKLLGKKAFNNRLDSLFLISQQNIFGGGKTVNAFAGIKAVYNHGNQPNLHVPWLFNYSGRPDLTQKWVRAICNEFYGADGVHGYGYGQDEDQGQLGAWYVMAALGLFDVQGHAGMNPTFQFGSPLFDKVTIQLNPKYYSGRTLVIETKNNSRQNMYVQSVSFNKTKFKNCWIDRKKLTSGGVLSFEMGAQPNTSFGVTTPPPSMGTDK